MNNENNIIPSMDNKTEVPSAPTTPIDQPQMQSIPAPQPEVQNIPVQPTEPVVQPTSQPEIKNIEDGLPFAPNTPFIEQPVQEVKQAPTAQDNTSKFVTQMPTTPTQTPIQTQPPIQNKPTPSVDLSSNVYIREDKKPQKNGNGRSLILLAVLVVMIIVFWPRINMALVNAGIIKEDKNVQSNENNQNANNNQTENPDEKPLEDGENITTTKPEDSKLPTKPTTPEQKPTQPSKPAEPTKPTPTTPPVVAYEWNGIYTKDNITLKVYKIGNIIKYTAETSEVHAVSSADITSTNNAKTEVFETVTTLKLNENSIVINTNDEYIKSGTYTKTKKYTNVDYYKDNIGKTEYLNTNLSGVYQSNGTTIKIFQRNSFDGRIRITKNNKTYTESFFLLDDNEIHIEDGFIEEVKIDAILNGSTLTVTASSSKSESILNQVNGTYTKTGPYSIDDIIKDNLY